MESIMTTTLVGLFFGTFGTTIGGIIGIYYKTTSKKALGFILSLASGLMLSIVAFELLPEALEMASTAVAILGILCGVVVMILCDQIVKQKPSIGKRGQESKSSLLKTGMIISIGLALHNFPEGLAIRVRIWSIN